MKKTLAIVTVLASFYGCSHERLPVLVAASPTGAKAVASQASTTPRDVRALILLEVVGYNNGCDAYWLDDLRVYAPAAGSPDRFAFSGKLYCLGEDTEHPSVCGVKGWCNPLTREVRTTSEEDVAPGCFGSKPMSRMPLPAARQAG